MEKNEDGAVSVCVYRLCNGTTRTDWHVVARSQIAWANCDELNNSNDQGGWTVEVLVAKIPIYHIRGLIGYLCGSQTGGQKASVARNNGKKGGRPKKPIDGLITMKSTPESASIQKWVIDANLPPH